MQGAILDLTVRVDNGDEFALGHLGTKVQGIGSPAIVGNTEHADFLPLPPYPDLPRDPVRDPNCIIA